jgi:hypothetical protein
MRRAGLPPGTPQIYAPGVSETPGNGRADGLPEWYMPPQMIGGHVTGPVLIARSDQFVLAARQVLAFPVGVEVQVEAHARGAWPGEMPLPGPEDFADHPQPRFRVRFADGRAAAQDDEAGLRSGRGPMLVVSGLERSSGGPDGREDIRLGLWIWPLPPPGPLTVTCSWPNRGLHDAALLLDGDAIRAAAGQARPYWP